MGELAKIESFRRDVAIAETIDQVKTLSTKGELLAEMAKKLKIPLDGQNELGKTRIELEKKKRDLIEEKFPKGAKKGTNNREIVNSTTTSLQNYGISWGESSDAKIIKEETVLVEEAMKEIVKSKEVITPRKVASKVRKKKKEKEKETRKKEFEKKSKNYNNSNIIILNEDFYNYSQSISENSIDAIITDPPYPGKYLHLWEQLFEVSYKLLKPSSFLVCYSGQMYLDKIFKMKNELIYYWTANIVFSQKPLIAGRNIINEWKPILIFQKPPFKKISDTISDTISFNYSERDLHEKNWGQTIAPFEFLINSFSQIDDLIFEPFAGTGTTLIACKKTGRRCIGTEINNEYIDLIKGRLVE